MNESQESFLTAEFANHCLQLILPLSSMVNFNLLLWACGETSGQLNA
jgi:hypothetical protein